MASSVLLLMNKTNLQDTCGSDLSLRSLIILNLSRFLSLSLSDTIYFSLYISRIRTRGPLLYVLHYFRIWSGRSSWWIWCLEFLQSTGSPLPLRPSFEIARCSCAGSSSSSGYFFSVFFFLHPPSDRIGCGIFSSLFFFQASSQWAYVEMKSSLWERISRLMGENARST